MPANYTAGPINYGLSWREINVTHELAGWKVHRRLFRKSSVSAQRELVWSETPTN